MTANDHWWHKDPEQAKNGIGVVLHWKPKKWLVVQVLSGSPAEIAGIQVGDVLSGIDEYNVFNGGDIEEAFHLLHLHESIPVIKLLREEESISFDIPHKPLTEILDKAQKQGMRIMSCSRCKSCLASLTGYTDCFPGSCSSPCRIG